MTTIMILVPAYGLAPLRSSYLHSDALLYSQALSLRTTVILC